MISHSFSWQCVKYIYVQHIINYSKYPYCPLTGPPIDVVAEATECNSATVSWSAPNSKVCDGVISSYSTLRYRLNGSTGDYTTMNTSGISVTLQGLTPNEVYTVEVAVITSVGSIGLYSAVARLHITGEF